MDSRRRRGRPKPNTGSVLSAASPIHGTPDPRGAPGVAGMSQWLEMMGYSVGVYGERCQVLKAYDILQSTDINALNIIHVAGTKGKGSTCAFTESVLRAHSNRTGYPSKIGVYTSPHLIHPEERIRINGKPIALALFAKYFFELYERLPQLAMDSDMSKEVVERGPRYLQLWALLAFHVFAGEGVDAAIFETHSGGEYDATNVVQKPIVTAVTTLGMDHISMLGPTIQNIAWHKSGIFKSGAAALSTTQELTPGKVLQQRAAAKGEELQFVDLNPYLPRDPLKLGPLVQRKNASLAVAIAQAFLQRAPGSRSRDRHLTSEDIAAGVELFTWPGRFQLVPDGRCTWFLDAAHNDTSVPIAADWFSQASRNLQLQRENIVRVLIFSQITARRDTTALLESAATALKNSASGVQHVIFTTYDESEERRFRHAGQIPNEFHSVWRKVYPGTRIWDEAFIQGAMERARSLGDHDTQVHTLITGSQNLVGPALRILQASGVMPPDAQ